MHPYLLYNAQMISTAQPCLSAMDRGFLLGDGLFETLRAYNGRLPFWDLHVERLKHGMSEFGFSFAGIDFVHIEEMTRYLLDKNAALNAYVRLTVTRGDSNPGLLPEWGKEKSNWVVFTRGLPPNLEANQKNGIRAIISSVRKSSFSPTSCFKTINYLDAIVAKREALLAEAQEAILLDENGFVAEATTSNLFWVKNGILYTPSLDMPILPGITRKKILEVAGKIGLPSQEGRFRPEELMECSELFITNSIYEVVPVKCINNNVINDYDRPVCIALKLHAEYLKNISGYI